MIMFKAMLLIKRALTVIGLFLVTNSVYAAPATADVCIEGITLSATTNKEKYEDWSAGFASFFSSASQGKKFSILNSYSSEDGSQAEIERQMSKIDKFGRYAETKYSSIEQAALLWGDYLIRNVTYQFRGQSIVLPEPMLCQRGNCEMTTLAENVDSDSQLLNLFLQGIGAASQRGKCKTDVADGTAVALYPSYRQSERNPITIKFSNKQVSSLDDFTSIDEFIVRCGPESTDNLNEEVSFNPGCFTGGIDNLIPAVELSGDERQTPVYFGLDVLMRILATEEAIQKGFSLKMAGSNTLLIKLRSAIGRHYIVALPFQSNNKMSLDLIAGAQTTILLRSELIAALFKKN